MKYTQVHSLRQVSRRWSSLPLVVLFHRSIICSCFIRKLCTTRVQRLLSIGISFLKYTNRKKLQCFQCQLWIVCRQTAHIHSGNSSRGQTSSTCTYTDIRNALTYYNCFAGGIFNWSSWVLIRANARANVNVVGIN